MDDYNVQFGVCQIIQHIYVTAMLYPGLFAFNSIPWAQDFCSKNATLQVTCFSPTQIKISLSQLLFKKTEIHMLGNYIF